MAKKNVLHADDVVRWRDYVTELLSDKYEIVAVEDCDAVVERIASGDIDLLILDHLMPGTAPLDTGYEVCQHVRKHHPHVPIIIYTGAWQGAQVDRSELEAKMMAPVVFKDSLDPEKDDLLARVSEQLA